MRISDWSSDVCSSDLVSYRLEQKIDLWRKAGIVLPRDIWDRFHFHFACVSGSVRKCRPWYWDLLDNARLRPMFELAQIARIKPITAEMLPHIRFPLSCQPICDGVITIYERERSEDSRVEKECVRTCRTRWW